MSTTMRTIPRLLPLLLACGLPAQFSATLTANQPIEATLTTTSSHPAGPLTTSGTVSSTISPYNIVATALWQPPTPTNLSCTLRETLDTGSLPGSWWPATFQIDATLEITGPTGAWGTIVVTADRYGTQWPTVDVGNDGTNDTSPAGFYGGVGPGAQRYEWSIPVQLGAAPLPVRILMPTAALLSPGFLFTEVRFVPWSPNATDLGSGCTPNHVGWIVGQNSAHDYSMAVLPGSGAAAATLHARGYGQLQVFAVDLQSARLPVGTIPFGNGCDDLLLGASVTAPGVPTPFSDDDEWTLDVPVLPPGLTFYLQHVSLGGQGNPIYFGATNVVRYQT
ncbi:MAG: hypothetical protein R3F29_01750 [Planctomycetota bacterium]